MHIQVDSPIGQFKPPTPRDDAYLEDPITAEEFNQMYPEAELSKGEAEILNTPVKMRQRQEETKRPAEEEEPQPAAQQQHEAINLKDLTFSQRKKLAKMLRMDYLAFGALPVKPSRDSKAYRDKFVEAAKSISGAALRKAYDEMMESERGKRKRIGDFTKVVQSAGKVEGGLYNDQIDKIMSRFRPSFLGCIMRDQIKTLMPEVKPHSRISFIINTDPYTKEGSHWQAIYIDARDGPESSNSIEFYDSFGRSIEPEVLHGLKLLIKMLKPSTVLKLKENKVIMQSDNSSNCGWFCVRFLIDRYRNQSFASATGFDDKFKISEVTKNEKEIKKMKEMPKFDYIF